jgi:hypothetical protein
VRVSTDGQTVENQARELRQIADRRGREVIETYSDSGISGAKGRDKREIDRRWYRTDRYLNLSAQQMRKEAAAVMHHD